MDLSAFEGATVTLQDVLDTQARLEKEAAELDLGDLDRCTHDDGHKTQTIWSCLTCTRESGKAAGICAACSIQCHSNHELVELLHRRNFQCDCGTVRLGDESSCLVGKRYDQDPNEGNRYDHNFAGTFCVCRQPYNHEAENATMFQCLGCEDWFHDTCVIPTIKKPGEANPALALEAEEFDAFVCAKCSTIGPCNKTAGRWRGAPNSGVLAIGIDGNVYGRLDPNAPSAAAPAPAVNGEIPDEPPAKRQRTETVCKAPISPEQRYPPFIVAPGNFAGAFFVEGFVARWCRCDKCLPDFATTPYLLVDEAPVPPPAPVDPNAGKSLYQLGSEALDKLPREQVIEGLLRYGDMRDKLVAFLRTKKGPSDTVTKEDIETFFAEQRQATA